jgi:hypothetical protein
MRRNNGPVVVSADRELCLARENTGLKEMIRR